MILSTLIDNLGFFRNKTSNYKKMSLATLENVTGEDKDQIFDVLEKETYPCSVTDIRMKLKKRGVALPDYLITRSLRILLSEGKAQLNGRKWSISSGFEKSRRYVKQGSSIGYAPRKIEIPIDISKIINCRKPVAPSGPKSPPEGGDGQDSALPQPPPVHYPGHLPE